MKKLLPMFILLALATTGGMATAHADQLGDPAPALQAQRWINSETPPDTAGKIVVVDLWATWCPACRATLPEVDALARQHAKGGVVVIGLSVDESPEEVDAYLREHPVSFPIAIDPEMRTAEAFSRSFGVDGIPYTFVIDRQGKVAWAGHPRDLGGVLERVLAGTYRVEDVRKEAQARGLFGSYLDLVAIADASAGTLAAAAMLGREIMDLARTNPRLLSVLAWRIMTDEAIAHRDLALALAMSALALERSEGKDPLVLTVYARALFFDGRKALAITTQQRAIELEQDAEVRAEYQAFLEEYQR